MGLLAWESLVLQSTGCSTTISHKISRSVFQLHGLLWLSNNTSVRENRWCAGPNQQPRETNGRVSPNICFPFPGSMQRMALTKLVSFSQILLLAGCPRWTERNVHKNPICLWPRGILPRDKGRLFFLNDYTSCNSFLKSGTSWEIHHEATSRVSWLA